MMQADRGALWRACLGVAFLMVVSSTSEVTAQEPLTIQLEHFEPLADPTTNILNVASSGVLPHLQFNTGAAFHIAQDPLTFAPAEGNREPQRLVGDQIKGELLAAFGLFNFFNIELAVPMILSQGQGQDLAPVGRPGDVTEGFGLLDPRITPKISIMDRKYVGGLGVGVTFPMYIPIGQETQLNSQGGFRIEPRVVVDWKHRTGILVAGNIDYQLRRWGVAASSPLFVVKGLSAHAVGFGDFPVGQNLLGALVSPNQQFSTNPVEVLGGLQYTTPWDVTVGLSAGQGLTGGMGAATFRGVFSVSWTPEPDSDTDQDGNIDLTDQCPNESEDFDGHLDSNGCPDIDNDKDGILDDDDDCKFDKEDFDGFEDEDGCPDIDNHEEGFTPDPIEFTLTATLGAPTLPFDVANGPPQRPRAASSPDRIYSVEGAKVLGHLDTGTELQFEPVRTPGDDRPVLEQGGLMNTNLFAIGLFDVVELGADAPIFISKSEPVVVGDPRAQAKVMIVDPGRRNVGVALALPVVLPVQDSAFSRGILELGPTGILEIDTSPIRTRLNFGGIVLKDLQNNEAPLSGRLRYGVAGEYSFLAGRFDVGMELTGERDFQNFLRSQQDAAFGVVLGLKWKTLEGIDLVVGTNFSQGPDQLLPELGGFGSLKYTTVVSDYDNDGISDPEDLCATVAEDYDDFEDTDGCPERDNDGDGISDLNDLCPGEAEDKNGIQDEDGCPERDADGDGVPDGLDKCPELAGFKKSAGCPDLDDDGVMEDDQCPQEPEDKDGWEDEDGCPELNNDGDSLPDAEDRCPDVAGIVQWQGCMDVVVEVFFPRMGSLIDGRSFKTLNAMADIIKTNPAFAKIEIQGHTDDLGSAEGNLALSERRARAVRAYLIRKGIEAERLTAVGFGKKQPIIPIEGLFGEDLKEARAKNRRVVFKLLRAETPSE